MLTAGMLVAYNQQDDVGPDAFELGRTKGERAMWLAYQQSQTMIARSYLTPWASLPTVSWSDRLGY